MIITPLYLHTNEETAHLVNDYPYSGLRCRIRYWLESSKNKGWRFCSQTENPKTFRWNAPKKSTYAMFGACLYIDENGHTKWAAITQGSESPEVLNFIESFPHADLSGIKTLALVRFQYAKRKSEGQAIWKVNGVPQAITEAEIAQAKEDIVLWEKCLDALEASKIFVTPPSMIQCDTPDGKCINHGACNAADKCIRPRS